ncbi:MAG: DUF1080 domain-containing protein [Phycisphaerae bacterium]|jgi:hypothetical protein|nr:DUF1080 domain-containing protein [Phycisphaerae bacterium]MBT5365341.1 DUF1080 domain-containing protein [Phycisphaerae bacterium]MBT6269710.1 DUF1080 domain-containing protein [Phycisphaerae bacterium]MBT6282897.1 DUF1080 domain-containing protein [Phycisphaerae bacterium]
MKKLLLIVLVGLLSGCGPQKAETPSWRGFKKETLPSGWRMSDDGVLTHTKGGGDIVTDKQYQNFILELDWKISEGGNSGIFFHVNEEHDYVWLGGPEMQILDNVSHANGMKPETSAGANYALHAPCCDVTKPVGEWNHVKLVVDGPHVEHWLNGKKLLEYELWSDDWKARVAASKFKDMPPYGLGKTGHIALQDHGDIVSFRNIQITPLESGTVVPGT